MSFVPAPQQANAASAKSNVTSSVTAASAAAEPPVSDQDLLFKTRTFDVFWVDRKVRTSTVFVIGGSCRDMLMMFCCGIPFSR